MQLCRAISNKCKHTAIYAFVPMKVFAMESINYKTHNETAVQIPYATKSLKSQFQTTKIIKKQF